MKQALEKDFDKLFESFKNISCVVKNLGLDELT